MINLDECGWILISLNKLNRNVQIIFEKIAPFDSWEEREELKGTERDSGGFGSTGS